MRQLKKFGLVLLAILGILFIVGYLWVQNLKPDYEGEKSLSKLSGEVQVYFDTYGVPHIYAGNEEDAFRALGYVHAQDRLWQMELLRRVARGGLSEVFGKDLIDTDRFFLSLGIDDASTETVSALDKNQPMVKLSQAYLDGINAFVQEGPTPIEFYLTGIKKTPFVLEDIYNSIGYMSFSFAMAHKTDPLLTAIKNKLGPEYLADLGINVDPNTVLIQNFGQGTTSDLITASVYEALEDLPIPQFEGSNSWVIGSGKTKNGSVILANDPHIGFAQPSVWYEAHLVTPTYEKYGYHLAGVPFPLLGHDRNLAYGLTMFENDDVDFYFEETHPSDKTKYRFREEWKDFKQISKTIKVKDSGSIKFNFHKTDHGPVLNGIAKEIEGERPVSMSWIYTQEENKVLHALYAICHAENMETFREALPNIHAPGLNVMYGDSKGNIAWWATAKLYKMPDSLSTKLILDGSSGKDERMGYLDFVENPSAVNPPWQYVYSANNQPDSINGSLYPGYYLPENRAKRIVQLLEAKEDWDKTSVGEMITDGTSSVNPSIAAELARQVDYKQLSDAQIKVLDELSTWQGNYGLKSTQGTVFHRWIYNLLKNTFADELGEEHFSQFIKTHLHKRVIAPMILTPSSVWWDDTNTEDIVEIQKNIITTSLVEALESLTEDFGEDSSKWTWDRVHTLEHGHPIGQVAALRSFFNVGPFPVRGSREVINNMSFTYVPEGFYNVGSGPSTRRIIDFSDLENGLSILPTGQSGNPFSPHYDDQAELFINGQFRKMMMNKDEIMSSSESLLIFKKN